MSLTLCMPNVADLKPRIVVFGIGGAGGNAINNMISKNLEGVEFVVANTDAQALQLSMASHKVQLGEQLTEGLGAGASPDIGAAAARESIEAVKDYLQGCHMCFITAGMGGGTGTGAAPVIAEVARELGVLTVGVVTKPFDFEGVRRMCHAEDGLFAIRDKVDTLLVIPNQNLFRIANEKTTITEAFAMADEVLYQGVKGVTDLMVKPGIINLDFSDIRSVMNEMGQAMMGTGECSGDGRAVSAAESAISNPLLDEVSFKGARGVLINITGGPDMTLFEIDEAANRIRQELDPDESDANIIVGSTQDASMEGKIKVSVVATGIDRQQRMGSPQSSEISFESDHQSGGNGHHVDGIGTGGSNGAYHDDEQAEVDEGQFPAMHGSVVHDEAVEQEPGRSMRATVTSEDDFGDSLDRDQEPAAPETRHAGWQDPHGTEVSAVGSVAMTEGTDSFDNEVPAPAYQSRTTGTTSGIMHADELESDHLSRMEERFPETPAYEHASGHQRDPAHEVQDRDQRAHGHGGHRMPERGRNTGFGLNNLISRMTGLTPSSHSDRREPTIGSSSRHRDDAGSESVTEMEQNEIPAFLRRQAN